VRLQAFASGSDASSGWTQARNRFACRLKVKVFSQLSS
jgi:hypothetical protein